MGIEPTWSAWKAEALPLSYTRTPIPSHSSRFRSRKLGKLEWAGRDSNPRSTKYVRFTV